MGIGYLYFETLMVSNEYTQSSFTQQCYSNERCIPSPLTMTSRCVHSHQINNVLVNQICASIRMLVLLSVLALKNIRFCCAARTTRCCGLPQDFTVEWYAKHRCFLLIRKYSSTSYVGMGWVQNGVLYLRYRSDFAITKAEHCKVFIHKYSLLF